MTLKELSRDQITELKQTYLCENNSNVSWDELANADRNVSDEELENYFSSTAFFDDDFRCTALI
jgi:hypothetical protein